MGMCVVYGLFQSGREFAWLNSGRGMDVPVQAVFVSGSEENIVFSGSSK